MTRFLSALIFVAATIVGSAVVADDFGWENYVNGRYGYSIDVPTKFLHALPPPNGEGLGFQNNDRTVSVAVWGANNALEWSLDDYYDAAFARDDLGRVTYKRKTDKWYVLSGFRTVDSANGPIELIFYDRVAINSAGTAISGLTMLFLPTLKEFMDPIVTRMSRSLKPPSLPGG